MPLMLSHFGHHEDTKDLLSEANTNNNSPRLSHL